MFVSLTFDTLSIHVFDDVVPSNETVAVAVQIKAGYGNAPSDYRMNSGASVADHENELAVGKDAFHVA